jgi:hypothetical protein
VKTNQPIDNLTPAQVASLSALATEHGLCAPCACNKKKSPLTRYVVRSCDCGVERSGLCDECWPQVKAAIDMELFKLVECVDCGAAVFVMAEESDG